MKTLEVMHFNTQQPVIYLLQNDEAEAAYALLKAAMAEFKPYGNDKNNITISVQSSHGELTFRIDHLTSVGVGDPIANEELQLTWAEHIARVRARAKNTFDQATESEK